MKRATKLIPHAVVLMEMVPLRVRQLTAGFPPLINVPLGMGLSDVALSEILGKELGNKPGLGASAAKITGLLELPPTLAA